MRKIHILELNQDNPDDREEDMREEEKGVETQYDAASADTPPARAERWRDIARKTLYAWAFVFPLVLAPITLFPVEIHKQVLTLIAVVICLICFFATVAEERAVQYGKIPLLCVPLLLAVVAGVSAIFSKALYVSMYGHLVQPDSVLAFVLYALLFYAAYYFLSQDDFTKVAGSFLAGISIVSLVAILQIMGVYLLPWSFTRNPAFTPAGSIFLWAVLAAATLAALVSFPVNRFSGRTRAFLTAAGLLMLIGLIVLNFQIVWIALAIVTMIVAAIRFVRRESTSRAMAMIVISLFFAIISNHLPAIGQTPFEVRLNAVSSFKIAQHAVWSSRLALGTGPATFGYDYVAAKPSEVNQTQLWNTRFEQGYNVLITALATMGILGVLMFVLFAVFLIYRLLRSFENEPAIIVGSALLLLMSSWLFYPASFSALAITFFAAGLFAAVSHPKRSATFSHISPRMTFVVFIAITLLIAGSLAGLYVVGRKYVAAVYYEKGLVAANGGNADQAVVHINSAITWNETEDVYWRSLSQAVLGQIRAQQQQGATINQVALQQQVGTAIAVARQATGLNPADPLNWENLGNVYENLIVIANGADALARENYEKAIELDPVNPRVYFNIARTLAATAQQIRATGGSASDARQKTEEARRFIAKAVELKPDFVPARFLDAQMYLSEGNLDEAIKRAQEIQQQNPLDAGLAFQIGVFYYQNDQIDQAQQEFERAVSLSDDYSDARYLLGIIYDRKGLKQQAKEQFEKIQQANPDNEDIKTIIRNIDAGRPAIPNAGAQVPPPPPSGEGKPESTATSSKP